MRGEPASQPDDEESLRRPVRVEDVEAQAAIQELGEAIGAEEPPLNPDEAATPPRLPPSVLLLVLCSSSVLGFTYSVVSIFINKELQYGPVEVTRYWLFVGLISWGEPLVGFLVDCLIVYGEKRRPVFLLSTLGSCVLSSVICFVPAASAHFYSFVGLSIVLQLCMMGQYISVDGVLMSLGREKDEGTQTTATRTAAVLSRAMIWQSAGTLVGCAVQTLLLTRIPLTVAFGFVSAVFFFLFVLMFCFDHKYFVVESETEEAGEEGEESNPVGRRTWGETVQSLKALRQLNFSDRHSDGVCLVLSLLFVLVYSSLPDSDTVYYNYLFSLHFDTWMYSLLNCFSCCGRMLGSYVFSRWARRREKRDARGGQRTPVFFFFLVGGAAGAVSYTTSILFATGVVTRTLHIPAGLFILVDGFLASLLGIIAYAPILLIATEMAPSGLDLSCLLLFRMLSMAGGTISSVLTLTLLHTRLHDKLWLLILLCMTCRILLCPFSALLPDKRHDAGDEASPPTSDEQQTTGAAAAESQSV